MVEKISKQTWKNQTDCERHFKKAIKLRKEILPAWLISKSSEQAEWYSKARRTLALVVTKSKTQLVWGEFRRLLRRTFSQNKRFYKLSSKSEKKAWHDMYSVWQNCSYRRGVRGTEKSCTRP